MNNLEAMWPHKVNEVWIPPTQRGGPKNFSHQEKFPFCLDNKNLVHFDEALEEDVMNEPFMISSIPVFASSPNIHLSVRKKLTPLQLLHSHSHLVINLNPKNQLAWELPFVRQLNRVRAAVTYLEHTSLWEFQQKTTDFNHVFLISPDLLVELLINTVGD